MPNLMFTFSLVIYPKVLFADRGRLAEPMQLYQLGKKVMMCSPGCNPHWNASMQFLVKDLQQDILCLTVFDRDFFSPNEFLGRSELRVADIVAGCEERRGPVNKVSTYEIETLFYHFTGY